MQVESILSKTKMQLQVNDNFMNEFKDDEDYRIVNINLNILKVGLLNEFQDQ